MQVALYADGRPLDFDEATNTFKVGDAPVTAQQVAAYDAAGQLAWSTPESRSWFQQHFAPIQTPAIPASPNQPAKKRRTGLIIGVAAALLVLFGLCGVVGSLSKGASSSSSSTTTTGGSSTESAPQDGATDGSAGAADTPVNEPAEPEPAPAAPAEQPAEPAMTTGQQQAVEKAQSYLEMGGFSRTGLIKQLTFEEFSEADAKFAVDHIAPDWNDQAAQKAKSYMEMGGFSRGSLIKQLTFEGFTQAQAEYGVKAAGY